MRIFDADFFCRYAHLYGVYMGGSIRTTGTDKADLVQCSHPNGILKAI